MKIYLLKVENVLRIPKSYIQDDLTQYQGSKGHSATSDGCLLQSNSGHLRPSPPPSLHYLMPLILSPQMSEPMPASASLMACNLCMVVGSGNAMIWWHRCSTHGKREGKAARGRVATAHVGWLLCVLCVLYVVVVFCGCVLCFAKLLPYW
jgi:hypothetical protein